MCTLCDNHTGNAKRTRLRIGDTSKAAALFAQFWLGAAVAKVRGKRVISTNPS
jgi:hypothetical protein